MPESRTSSPDFSHAEVATLAALHNFPLGLRKWGMRVTVYADPTAGNNTTWILVPGGALNKSDNANWKPTSIPLPVWNMDLGGTDEIIVDDNYGGWKGAECYIISDDGLYIRNLQYIDDVFGTSGSFEKTPMGLGLAGAFRCSRKSPGGAFANGNYNSLGLSRGYILLHY